MASQIEGPLDNEYTVSMCDFGNVSRKSHKSHKVVGNRDDETVVCTCKKFERIGILCWHALKVLDAMNIKVLPQHYILERWTQQAKEGTIEDRNGRIIIEDTKLDVALRNRDLCRMFGKIAAKAATTEKLSKFVEDALHALDKEVEENMQDPSKTTNACDEASPTPILTNNLSQNIPRLKKKEGPSGKKSAKRAIPWNEQMQKTKKGKTTHLTTSQAKIVNETEALSQQKLAAAEAEIVELRKKLQASTRMESNFSQDHLNEPSQEEQYGCFVDLEDKWNMEIVL